MNQTRVIWSTQALIDLEVIYDFLVEKSPSSAKRIIENILARARQLETFPESGTKQEFFKTMHKTYRYLVEGNYKLIYGYYPEKNVVYVEIIFDTRYNPDKMKV